MYVSEVKPVADDEDDEDAEDAEDAFIPHVFQQVTFGLMFKVQSGHLLRVSVFELLRHFDLEGEEEEDRTSTGSVISQGIREARRRRSAGMFQVSALTRAAPQTTLCPYQGSVVAPSFSVRSANRPEPERSHFNETKTNAGNLKAANE